MARTPPLRPQRTRRGLARADRQRHPARRGRAPCPHHQRTGQRLHPVRVRRHSGREPRGRRTSAMAAPAESIGPGTARERLLAVRRDTRPVQLLQRRRRGSRHRTARRARHRQAVRLGVRGSLGPCHPSRGLPARVAGDCSQVPVRSATAQQALDALAARLREIRKDAELTARQLALAAGWHESKCSRIEHARTMPSPEDIRTWCTICGVPDQAADLTAALRSIDSMYVEWRRMVRSGMRRLQEAPLPLYERTRQFRIYEPGVIPGLFQTAEYARARMGRIVEFSGIPDDLATAVPARLDRQRVLRRGDHRFAVVLEEWALRSRIGSTEMMAGQLTHLAQESALPSVTLGIIPVTAARTMWSSPGFWIYDETRVLIETPAAELAITQPREIGVYLRTFAELAAMAVYGSRARDLISRAITDFR